MMFLLEQKHELGYRLGQQQYSEKQLHIATVRRSHFAALRHEGLDTVRHYSPHPLVWAEYQGFLIADLHTER
jgi:hypothetical protein